MRKDQQFEEIKKQVATQEQYVEPVSGLTAEDAEYRMEDLHDLYYRFSLSIPQEDYTEDFVKSIGHTYYELRKFLQQIIKNGEVFDEFKTSKPAQ